MAAKKRSSKAVSEGLWLGAFSLLESGKGDAAFQIIARARGPEDAARIFEERLLRLRETTSLFKAEASVYLDAIIDLSPTFFPVPTLVNFVARKESAQSDIWSPVPEQPDSRAEIYVWGGDEETEKVIDRQAFLEFARRKQPSKSKGSSKKAKVAKKRTTSSGVSSRKKALSRSAARTR